jgi:hypothetical protein
MGSMTKTTILEGTSFMAFRCSNSKCRNVHLLFFDGDGKPVCHAAMDPEFLLEEVQNPVAWEETGIVRLGEVAIEGVH